MKISLIHDTLNYKGGAERVFLYFIHAFPNSDIYTLSYHPENTYKEFKNYDIKPSWYNKIAKSEKFYKKLFFPLGVIAAKNMNLKKYDVILQSTTREAKYAKYHKNSLVICYCHQPFRFIWSPNSYKQFREASFLKKQLYNLVIYYLKKIDYKSAQRPDVFIANSQVTAERINQFYGRNVDKIINPPVDVNNFHLSSEIDNYYLVVSRFEPYKKVDLAIEAFNELQLPLIVVGNGTQKAYLKKLAKENIDFKEDLSDKELALLYSKCKAFIFPQIEDYGITPLEANASGRPVIAYNKGGIKETMIPYYSNPKKATALFFNHQDKENLKEAVTHFENIKNEFNPDTIRKHAEQFSIENFIEQIQGIVSKYYDLKFK